MLLTSVASADEMVAYLFTYFNSNDPKDEQICYAISDDGYNYTPLNHGLPVISSDTIAYTQCVRDPHILRCEDGKTFYMVVTDMRSAYGWSSNRGMVLLKSTDLINWTHSAINFPTRYTKEWKNVIRVWAPETIYDHKTGKYMVFYSVNRAGSSMPAMPLSTATSFITRQTSSTTSSTSRRADAASIRQ